MRYARLLLLFSVLAAACGSEPKPINTSTSTSYVAVHQAIITPDVNDGYPIQPLLVGKASIEKMAELHLHPMPLKKDWVGLNYNRVIHRFLLDTVRTGTMVYADINDIPRFKASCWNKLMELGSCPLCITAKADTLLISAAQADSIERAVAAKTGSSFWATVGHNIGTLWDGFKAFMSWLLPLLLALLIGLVVWELFGRAFVDGLRRGWNGTGPVPTPAPVPPVAPTPGPTPTPAPPAPTPTPGVIVPAYPPKRVIRLGESDEEHVVRLASHKDGTYAVHMTPGVDTVQVRRVGPQQAYLEIHHR